MKISKYFNEAQREALFASFVTFTCGAATGVILYLSNKTAIFVSGIILALGLFLLRMRVRVIYAFIEIGFALYVLWNAAGKGRGAFSSGFGSGFDTFQMSVVLIQTFGAIYILVRGLDNLFQAMPAEARTRIETRIKLWHV